MSVVFTKTGIRSVAGKYPLEPESLVRLGMVIAKVFGEKSFIFILVFGLIWVVFIVFMAKYLFYCSVFLTFAHCNAHVQLLNDGDLELCQYRKRVKS